MNKLATAMQEGEYDAERPPSKVGNSRGPAGARRSGTWGERLLLVGGLGGRNLGGTSSCLKGKGEDFLFGWIPLKGERC